MEGIYYVLTTPWLYALGCLICGLLCIAAAFFEKKKLKKFTLTVGDIIIYIMLTALSWIGLIVATVVCLITNTEWLNKVIMRL